MSALDAFGTTDRALIRDVLLKRDEALLVELDRDTVPTRSARERVVDAMASEFDECVSGPDWEPTEHGRNVDDALGRFLLRFPIERDE